MGLLERTHEFGTLLQQEEQQTVEPPGATVEPPGATTAPLTPEPSRLIERIRQDQPNPRLPLDAAAGTNPDQNETNRRRAKELGIPVEAVETAPEATEDLVRQRRQDEALSTAPVTRNFLADPEKAKVAHEDVEELSAFERFFRDLWHDITEKTPDAFDEGVSQVEQAAIGIERLGAQVGALDPVTRERLERLHQLEKGAHTEASTFVGGVFVESSRQLPIMGQTVVSALAGAGTGAATGILAGPKGAAIGAAIGGKLGAALSAFELEGGLAFNEFTGIKDINGVALDPDIAAGAAIAVGTVNAGLELFSLNLLLKTVPGGSKLLGFASRKAMKDALKNKTVQQALQQVAKRYAQAAVGEGATEAAQELMTMMGAEVAKMAQGGNFENMTGEEFWERILSSAGAGFKASLGLGLPGSVITAARDTRRISKAKAHHEKVTQLLEVSKENALAGRSPELFQEYLGALAADAERGDTLIAIEPVIATLQDQGVDVVEFFGELGVEEADLAMALDTGEDVGVDTAVMVTKLMDSEHLDTIALNIREEDAALTMAEAELQSVEVQKQIDLIAKSFEPGQVEADALTQARQEAAAVSTQFRQQAVEQGKVLPQNARNVAALLEAQFVTETANRLAEGKAALPIADFYKQFGVTVTNEAAAGQAALSQDSFRQQMDNVIEFVRKGEAPPAEVVNPFMDALDEVSRILKTGSSTDPFVIRGLEELDRIEASLGEGGSLEGLGLEQMETLRDVLTSGQPFPANDLRQAAAELEVDETELATQLAAAGGDITQTPAFQAWFGNSVIVDENGDPLVVYHGTKAVDIEEFIAKYPDGLLFFTTNSAFAAQWADGREATEEGVAVMQDIRADEKRIFDEEFQARGANLEESVDILAATRDRMLEEHGVRSGFQAGEITNSNVLPVYLSVQNLFDPATDGAVLEDFLTGLGNGMDILVADGRHLEGHWIIYEKAEVIDELKRLGYDGIRLRESTVSGAAAETIAVFEPTQIKSVFNRGTFSQSDANILHQAAQRDARSLLDFVQKNPDGFTVSVDGKNVPPSGFAFAPIKGTEIIVPVAELTEDHIDQLLDFIDRVQAITGGDVYAGGWLDGDRFVLDASLVMDSLDQALYSADGGSQDAIFDLGEFNVIDTQEGLDRLRQDGTYSAEAHADARAKAAALAAEFEGPGDRGEAGDLFQSGINDDGDHPLRISTRAPITQRATEDPVAENLTVDLEAMRAGEAVFRHNTQLIKTYPGFHTRLRDPDKVAEAFIQHVTDNLLWLYDQVPADVRARSQQWYDGARAIVDRLAAAYNIPDAQVAAVFAVLSPQKDWFQNASLGERVIDIHEQFTRGNKRGFIPDKKMQAKARELFGKSAFKKMRLRIMKQSYADLSDATEKAMWLRVYDQAHNPRGFRTLTPEGQWVGEATGKTSWGSLVEISKAIRALESANDPAALHEIMGGRHKVRNFYNNILAPNAPHGDVTIDTHAVAAGLLRALSASSAEVLHNFATSPLKAKQPKGWQAAKSVGDTGALGTYGLYADAYRRAAAARGVSAREMQSITWEAIRGLFPAKFKQQQKNVDIIDAIWHNVDQGLITIEEARTQVLEAANGIANPEWFDTGDQTDAEGRGSSYDGELVGTRLPRGPARGVGSGSRSPDGTTEAPFNVDLFQGSIPQDFIERRGAAFDKLADDQRGKPESAMLRAQSVFGGGPLSMVLEHGGDVIHRMADKYNFFTDGMGYDVENKLRRVVRFLESPYGFEREMRENMRNNAAFRDQSIEEYSAELDAALSEYADAHRELTPHNEPQARAQAAAVAVGEKNWDEARTHYRFLLDWIQDDPDGYRIAAGTFEGQFVDNQDMFQGATGIGRLFSQARASVDTMPQEKATEQQWRKHFEKSGVKKAELEWIVGLDDFLKSTKTISKLDLAAFINQNGLKLDEVVLDDREVDKALEELEFKLFKAEEDLALTKQRRDEAERRGDEAATAAFQEELNGISDDVYELRRAVVHMDIAREGNEYIGQTHFTGYTLPGGENHREFYLTLPQGRLPSIDQLKAMHEARARKKALEAEHGITDNTKVADIPAEVRKELDELRDIMQQENTELTHGPANAKVEDWLVPHAHRIGNDEADNRLVVRVRVNERTDADGKRTLFIEEIQGDRQQHARDEAGFASTTDTVDLVLVRERLAAINKEKDRLIQEKMTELGYTSHAEINAAGDIEAGRAFTEWQDTDPTYNGLIDDMIEARRALHQAVEASLLPPPIPWATSNEWLNLALKRIIVAAAEEGYDSVSWTPGEVQADRYDLSRQIDNIDYYETADGFRVVLLKNNEIVHQQRGIEASELSGVVGKELADKIVAGEGESRPPGGHMGNPYKSLSGVDLKVGGEGMKAFYDKMVVNAANKLGKKFGAKVTTIEVKSGARDRDDLAVSNEDVQRLGLAPEHHHPFTRITDDTGITIRNNVTGEETLVDTHDEGDALIRRGLTDLLGSPHEVWSLPLTDALRDQVLSRGLPMFQDPLGPLGSFNSSNPTNVTIKMFEGQDLSTLLHESGHLFIFLTEQMASLPDASQRLKDNYAAMLKWVGAESAADLDLSLNGEAARDKQEKLARAFEVYLKEGKAPSVELQSVFAQFAQWLKRVYDGVRRVLGDKIDPEVREIFDRMLATDAEISEMRAINEFDTSQPTAAIELMTPEERAKWIEKNEAADEVARNEAARVHHEQELRAQQAAYQDDLRKAKETVEKELYKKPVYRAWWFLTRGGFKDEDTPPGLLNMRLAKQDLLDAGITQEQLNAIPKGKRAVYSTKQDGTMHPDVLAPVLGYLDGAALIKALVDMQAPQEAINSEADLIVEAQHPNPVKDGSLEELTEQALYNEERRRAIQIELDALARATGQQKVARGVIKGVVDRIAAERPLDELLRPSRYMAASIRAAKASAAAAATGDHQKAFVEKRKQMLQHELMRRSMQLREEVEKGNKYMRKFSRRGRHGGIQADYLDHIREVLDGYALGSVLSAKKRDQLTNEAFRAWMSKAEKDDGAIFIIPNEILEDQSTTHWRQLTPVQYQGLLGTVRNLEKQGRLAKQGISEKERVERDQIVAEMEARMVDLPQTAAAARQAARKPAFYDPLLSAVKSVDAAMIKTEFLLEFMDGGATGPAQRAIFQPFVDAEFDEQKLVENFSKQFADALEALPKKTRKGINKPVWNDALGQRISRNELLHIALNMGNASNMQKMIDGSEKDVLQGAVPFTEDGIMQALQDLSAEEIAFVNKVWELFEQMRPAVGEVYRREKSDTPIWMDPVETELENGTLTGGYIPMMYDPKRSGAAADIEYKSALEMMQAEVVKATVFSGMTQERNNSFSAPVALDISMLPNELQKTAHFITHYEAVRNANKIIGDPRVRTMVVNKFGDEYYQILQSWVGQVAAGSRGKLRFDVIGDLTEWLRSNATVAIMGASVTTTLTQPLGLFTAVDTLARGVDGKVKPGRGALAMVKGILGTFTPGARQQALAKSKELQFRMQNSDRDIQAALRGVKGARGNKAAVQRLLLMSIPMVQYYTVDVPTWIAAYNMGLKTMSSDDAAAFADATMRKTQGAGSAKDLSAVLATRGTSRAVTMFMTFFNTLYNIQRRLGREASWSGDFGYKLFMGSLVVYVLPSIIEGLFRLEGPDPNDDEDSYLEWLALKSLLFAGSTVPVARDFINGIGSAFGYDPTPLSGAGESVVRMLNEAQKIAAEEKELGPAALKSAVAMLGYLTGRVPSNQINRAIRAWEQLQEEDERTFNHWQWFVGPDRKGKN